MGLPEDRAGVPDWKNNERFKQDVFTFVRLEYDSGYGGYGGIGGGRRGGGGRWTTDWPDSDLNFLSYNRLPATDVAQGQSLLDHNAGDR